MFSRFVFLLSLSSVAAAGALIFLGYQFYRTEFPDVALLKTQYPVVHYEGQDEDVWVSLQRAKPAGWTTLAEISRPALGAVVVSEDWAFYQHKGYDPAQIKQAIRNDWEEGRFARGASTITQQVVRNVFLSQDKNLWRKLKELLLAVRIESKVGKKKILETYFNVAEWGEGIYGIRAASRHYFGKSPSELTAKEGAFLAMLLPSPKRYGVSYRQRHLTEYASDTVNAILGKMMQAHYISEDEKIRELAAPLSFELPPHSAM